MSTASWLYGIATQSPPDDLLGIDGIPVKGMQVGPIVAVYSEVPLSAWTGPQAEARLQDIQAIAPKLEQHMATQRAVHARSAFLPSAFGTLFSGVHSLKQTLRDPDLPRQVQTIGACEEWGVQAWASPLPEPQDDGPVDGAAWLMRRRQRDAARKSAEVTRRAVVEQLGARLEPCCVDAIVRPLPPILDEQDPDRPIANWALRVERDGGSVLAEVIARHEAELAGQGVRIRLTGPWPPSSFSAC